AGKLPLKNGDVGNERHRHARRSDPRFGLRPPASPRCIANVAFILPGMPSCSMAARRLAALMRIGSPARPGRSAPGLSCDAEVLQRRLSAHSRVGRKPGYWYKNVQPRFRGDERVVTSQPIIPSEE